MIKKNDDSELEKELVFQERFVMRLLQSVVYMRTCVLRIFTVLLLKCVQLICIGDVFSDAHHCSTFVFGLF